MHLKQAQFTVDPPKLRMLT